MTNVAKLTPMADQVYPDVAEAITRLRHGRGYTRAQVAEYLGLRIETIRRWEQGTHAPQGGSLTRVAKLFGVTRHQILGQTPITYVSVELPDTVLERLRSLLLV